MLDLRHSRKRLQGWVERTGHLCGEQISRFRRSGSPTLQSTNALSVVCSDLPSMPSSVGICGLSIHHWKRNCLGGTMYLMTLHGTTRRPLSERLRERLEKLDAKPALLFCKQCQTHKPNKMPYWKPGRSKCRHCERIR